jgi:hypothetical protein
MTEQTPAGPGGCRAAVSHRGRHIWCDQKSPHQGIPHGSTEAGGVVWCGVGADEDIAAAWAKADPEGER